MENFTADLWCDETLKDYDLAAQVCEELKSIPIKDGESTLMRSARLRRAENKLAAASAKAYAATLLLILIKASPRGEVTLNLPELSLDVRLTWQ